MKPGLLLLHGAIGSQAQLDPLADILCQKFEIYSFNFSGHGGEPIPEAEFSIPGFAGEVHHYLTERNISCIDIFGYSMGGYVGLYIANHFPASVNRIFTLATKFDWSVANSEKESRMLVPEKIEEKVPEFAKQLRERHSPQDWKAVLRKTAGMMIEMGKTQVLSKEDFRNIPHKILLAVGDKDKMVSMEETRETATLLPNASCTFLKDIPHPIEHIPLELLNNEVCRFLLGDPNSQ